MTCCRCDGCPLEVPRSFPAELCAPSVIVAGCLPTAWLAAWACAGHGSFTRVIIGALKPEVLRLIMEDSEGTHICQVRCALARFYIGTAGSRAVAPHLEGRKASGRGRLSPCLKPVWPVGPVRSICECPLHLHEGAAHHPIQMTAGLERA